MNPPFLLFLLACLVSMYIYLPGSLPQNWFQNRRAKAKLQKRQEELQTRQILESASRRRATEPSSPISSFPAHYYLADSPRTATTMVTPRPRRVKSTAELPKTPAARFQESMDSSPYDSPAEASYASLARSLAQAAAAAARANSVGGFQENGYGLPQGLYFGGRDTPYSQGPDGTQSPWPISRFSDYGSSNATPLYTPTPAGQLEDPFEYDCMAQSTEARDIGADSGPFSGYEYPTDDYSAFAAAIRMNTMSNTFSLPSAPPGRFVREKSVDPFDEPITWDEPHPSHFVRRDSCPGEFIEAFGSVEIEQGPFQPPVEASQSELQDSLAARRRRPKPTPLGLASLHRPDSSTGALPQSAREPKIGHLLQPATPMRRIKSTGASLNKRGGGISKVSPPSSPIDFRRFADYPFQDENYTMDGTTIRPRTSGSISVLGSTPLSQLFNHQSAAPPTPVSPADSDGSRDGASQQKSSFMEPVAIKFDHSSHNKADIESQMSPPATPSNSAESQQEEENEEEEKPEDTTPRIGFPTSSSSFHQDLSSIPRGFYGDESTMIDLFTYSMASAEAMSSSSASSGVFVREDAFPFERYLTQSGTAGESRVCVGDMF